MTETGAGSDLSAIEQRAAEDVFGAFDPVNHINYLSFEGRPREALAAVERFVTRVPAAIERLGGLSALPPGLQTPAGH
jgi:hypothetical protein